MISFHGWDRREGAHILPGRVVPKSKASLPEKNSPLVTWSLGRTAKTGASYVRSGVRSYSSIKAGTVLQPTSVLGANNLFPESRGDIRGGIKPDDHPTDDVFGRSASTGSRSSSHKRLSVMSHHSQESNMSSGGSAGETKSRVGSLALSEKGLAEHNAGVQLYIKNKDGEFVAVGSSLTTSEHARDDPRGPGSFKSQGSFSSINEDYAVDHGVQIEGPGLSENRFRDPYRNRAVSEPDINSPRSHHGDDAPLQKQRASLDLSSEQRGGTRRSPFGRSSSDKALSRGSAGSPIRGRSPKTSISQSPIKGQQLPSAPSPMRGMKLAAPPSMDSQRSLDGFGRRSSSGSSVSPGRSFRRSKSDAEDESSPMARPQLRQSSSSRDLRDLDNHEEQDLMAAWKEKYLHRERTDERAEASSTKEVQQLRAEVKDLREQLSKSASVEEELRYDLRAVREDLYREKQNQVLLQNELKNLQDTQLEYERFDQRLLHCENDIDHFRSYITNTLQGEVKELLEIVGVPTGLSEDEPDSDEEGDEMVAQTWPPPSNIKPAISSETKTLKSPPTLGDLKPAITGDLSPVKEASTPTGAMLSPESNSSAKGVPHLQLQDKLKELQNGQSQPGSAAGSQASALSGSGTEGSSGKSELSTLTVDIPKSGSATPHVAPLTPLTPLTPATPHSAKSAQSATSFPSDGSTTPGTGQAASVPASGESTPKDNKLRLGRNGSGKNLGRRTGSFRKSGFLPMLSAKSLKDSGRWSKVKESVSVYRDYLQSCELADNPERIDLLRAALLRHGCPVENSRLSRILTDLKVSAGLGMNYNQFLLIVRLAFAQRERELWIKLLNLDLIVDEAIHDTYVGLPDDPTEAFKITSDDAVRLFDVVREKALLKVETLNTESQVRHLTSQSSGGMVGAACNPKFATLSTTAYFGDLKQFFEGLDGHIGLPNPRIMEAMEAEHTSCEDSDDKFQTSNYGGTWTTSKMEWEFVTNPNPETHYPGQGLPGQGRSPEKLDVFLTHPNALRAGLNEFEVLALRLYTGPMFMKYNTALRKFPKELFDGLKGNQYVTTIHAIVSGIIKLSKIWRLPEDRKVFRGLGGMLLPSEFWIPDEFGCRGGVELGLLSTSTNREVALQYSGRSEFRPTIFEIDVGQVDRGASVNWLSQYPREDEILMPPLCNLEVVGMHRMELVEGVEVMVVPLRVNVNVKSLTMDELIGRRMTLHMAMTKTIRGETFRELHDQLNELQHKARMSGTNMGLSVYERDVSDIMGDFDGLIATHGLRAKEWYNQDEQYKSAIVEAVGMKRLALLKWGLLLETRRKVSGVDMMHMGNVFSVNAEKLLNRILRTNCQEFANEGVLFRLRSGYDDFPWEDVTNRSISRVEIPSDMERDQVILAWNCLFKSKEVVQEIKIQGHFYRRCFTTELDFGNRHPPMQSRGVNIVSGLLNVNTTVEKLRLTGCQVGDDGARSLSHGLETSTQLNRLELSTTQIGDKGMKSLAQPLAGRLPELQVLLLHENFIGDSGMTSLAHCLKYVTKLQQLDISKNKFSLSGAQELAWAFGRLSTISDLSLQHFNIGFNKIEEQGAIQLAQSITHYTSLRTLHLNETFLYTIEAGQIIKDYVPSACKVFGIGDHALLEAELMQKFRPGQEPPQQQRRGSDEWNSSSVKRLSA